MNNVQTYKVSLWGETFIVYLKYDRYTMNNALAVSLYSVLSDEESECIARITVNLPESAILPDDTQFIDVNNCPWVENWLIENSIAEPAGVIGRSGFCTYPAYKFKIEH